MKIARDKFEAFITKKIQSDHKFKSQVETMNIAKAINEKHNMPVSTALDIMSLRHEMIEYTDLALYCFLESYDPKLIPEYFLDNEIEMYEPYKYSIESIKFPLNFKGFIRVQDDQYIGVMNFRTLMNLASNQLINYNTNTQRPMKRIVNGEQEYYKISLNKDAVREIQESILNGSFIPNTITLNIPEDKDNDYDYNEQTSTLQIKKLDHFDILDGYHRWIALNKICIEDNKFDFTCMVQITIFPESKARQFIYQEDQKTQMTKVESSSLNQENNGNKVINKLNTDFSFNLAGQINMSGGLINAADYSCIINRLFFRDKRTYKMSDVINTKNKIKNGMNFLTECDECFMSKYDFKKLFCATYLIANDIPEEDMLDSFNKIQYVEDKIFSVRNITKAKNAVEKILK